MKTASIANVKARFSEHLRDLAEGPLVVTRHGRPVGVLLGVQDEDEIEQLILYYTPRLRPIAEAWDRRMRRSRASRQEEPGGAKEPERSEAPRPQRARPRKRGARKT